MFGSWRAIILIFSPKAFKGPSHLRKCRLKVTVLLRKQPLEIVPVSNPTESCVSRRYILYLGIIRQNLFVTQFCSEIQMSSNDRFEGPLRLKKKKKKPSFLLRKSLIHSLQDTPCHGCLRIYHYYSIMTGFSLCLGVTERLTRDSLHIGYPWRPLWCVAEELCTIEWQIAVAQKEWLALPFLPKFVCLLLLLLNIS